MKTVFTDKAPDPVAHYSQATVSNGFVFCAGQIGIIPATGELKGSDIISQTSQAIFNLKAVLEEAGSSLNNVVKTTVYLTDISSYQKFNEIYGNYFVAKPARATVEVSNLPKGALVEIEAIAVIN